MTSAQLSFLDSCDDVPGVTTSRRRLALFQSRHVETFGESTVRAIHSIVNDVMSRVDCGLSDGVASAIQLRLQNAFDDTSVPGDRRPAWNVVIGRERIRSSVSAAGAVVFADERTGELVLVWMS